MHGINKMHFRYIKKLINEHLYPSQQSKMRNHLAEDVLDEEMLHLFLEYQSTLGTKGSILDGPIRSCSDHNFESSFDDYGSLNLHKATWKPYIFIGARLRR
jgi:hypothetical protein